MESATRSVGFSPRQDHSWAKAHATVFIRHSAFHTRHSFYATLFRIFVVETPSTMLVK